MTQSAPSNGSGVAATPARNPARASAQRSAGPPANATAARYGSTPPPSPSACRFSDSPQSPTLHHQYRLSRSTLVTILRTMPTRRLLALAAAVIAVGAVGVGVAEANLSS